MEQEEALPVLKVRFPRPVVVMPVKAEEEMETDATEPEPFESEPSLSQVEEGDEALDPAPAAFIPALPVEITPQEPSGPPFEQLQAGHVDVYRAWIEAHPSDVHVTDALGYSMSGLHYAAHLGDEALVRQLLDMNVPVDALSEHRLTPLHLAARMGHAGCVRALRARRGGAPELKDSIGWTALHFAAIRGRVDVAEALLEDVGGHPSDMSEARSAMVNAVDREGITPLHIAACYGHVPFCMALIRAGASVHLPDLHGRLPLQMLVLEDPSAEERRPSETYLSSSFSLQYLLDSAQCSDVVLSWPMEKARPPKKLHRAVLAARAPYWRDYFSAHAQDPLPIFLSAEEHCLGFRSVPEGAWKLVLEYVYTGRISCLVESPSLQMAHAPIQSMNLVHTDRMNSSKGEGEGGHLPTPSIAPSSTPTSSTTAAAPASSSTVQSSGPPPCTFTTPPIGQDLLFVFAFAKSWRMEDLAGYLDFALAMRAGPQLLARLTEALPAFLSLVPEAAADVGVWIRKSLGRALLSQAAATQQLHLANEPSSPSSSPSAGLCGLQALLEQGPSICELDPPLDGQLPRKARALAGMVEEVYRECVTLMDALMTHPLAYIFNEPVNLNDWPNYCDIVKQPMDFGTIHRRLLSRNHYRSVRQLSDDIKLVFSNCAAFNMPGSEIIVMMEKLKRVYQRRIKKVENAEKQAQGSAAPAASWVPPIPSSLDLQLPIHDAVVDPAAERLWSEADLDDLALRLRTASVLQLHRVAELIYHRTHRNAASAPGVDPEHDFMELDLASLDAVTLQAIYNLLIDSATASTSSSAPDSAVAALEEDLWEDARSNRVKKKSRRV